MRAAIFDVRAVAMVALAIGFLPVAFAAAILEGVFRQIRSAGMAIIQCAIDGLDDAQSDQSPKGGDAKTGSMRKHASGVGEADAPKNTQLDGGNNG